MPGTRFYLEFRVDETRIGIAGVGLFFQALRQFIIEQNLGGWTKNGFGRFEVAQVDFEKLGSDQREQPLFEPSLGKAEFNQQSSLVLEALDDWAEAAQNLSAAEIEKLYELQED